MKIGVIQIILFCVFLLCGVFYDYIPNIVTITAYCCGILTFSKLTTKKMKYYEYKKYR